MEDKMQLLKVRNFNDVINDSLGFLKLNTNTLLRFILTAVLPFTIIGSWFFSGYFSFLGTMMGHGTVGLPDGFAMQMALIGIGMLLMMVAGICQATGLISLFTLYEKSAEGVVTADELFAAVKKDALRLVGFYFALMFFMVMAFALLFGIIGVCFYSGIIFLGVLLFIAVYVGMIYVSIAIMFSPFIYMRERLGVMESIKRSLYLIKGYWWRTFGAFLVMYFIVGFASMIFTIPFYAIWFNQIFSMARTGVPSFEFGIGGRLAVMFMFCGTSVLSSFIFVSVIMQYYNLVAIKEGPAEPELSSAPNQLYE